MPSIDEELMVELYDSGKPLFIAEQNNGYIWQNFLKVLYRRKQVGASLDRVITVNTLTAAGKTQFIHSGTYEELTAAFGLAAPQLASTVKERLAALKSK
jgi:hypothetical protein